MMYCQKKTHLKMVQILLKECPNLVFKTKHYEIQFDNLTNQYICRNYGKYGFVMDFQEDIMDLVGIKRLNLNKYKFVVDE